LSTKNILLQSCPKLLGHVHGISAGHQASKYVVKANQRFANLDATPPMKWWLNAMDVLTYDPCSNRPFFHIRYRRW
jgi:hypothetical protein